MMMRRLAVLVIVGGALLSPAAMASFSTSRIACASFSARPPFTVRADLFGEIPARNSASEAYILPTPATTR